MDGRLAQPQVRRRHQLPRRQGTSRRRVQGCSGVPVSWETVRSRIRLHRKPESRPLQRLQPPGERRRTSSGGCPTAVASRGASSRGLRPGQHAARRSRGRRHQARRSPPSSPLLPRSSRFSSWSKRRRSFTPNTARAARPSCSAASARATPSAVCARRLGRRDAALRVLELAYAFPGGGCRLPCIRRPGERSHARGRTAPRASARTGRLRGRPAAFARSIELFSMSPPIALSAPVLQHRHAADMAIGQQPCRLPTAFGPSKTTA